MNVKPALPAAALALCLLGCGGDDQSYTARPAASGKKPALAAVPTLPTKATKQGDSYTVWGAMHDLHSRVHADEVNGKKITVVGYVVKTNYDTAPKCAIHKTGKGDPPDCKSPLPTFSIADDKDDTKNAIDVMGWASNFAQLFTLMEGISRAAKGKETDVNLKDEFWASDLPNPIPNVGAKVKVTGTYGVTSTKTTGGAAADPKHGILTMEKIEYIEPPSERATLPGMRKR